MSRASLLALLDSPGWDAYINVSMVAAVQAGRQASAPALTARTDRGPAP